MSFNLVELIFNNLLALLPIKFVRTYERGVQFTLGNVGTLKQWVARKRGLPVHPEQLSPGMHVFIPYFQHIEVLSVVPEVINLPTQSLTTKDGFHITFSANIEYEVTDALLLFCGVQDFDNSLSNLAMNHLASRIREWTWKELQEGQKELETSMRATLTTRVKKWGVSVLSVGITDLVETKIYRIYGDAGSAGKIGLL